MCADVLSTKFLFIIQFLLWYIGQELDIPSYLTCFHILILDCEETRK